MVEQILFSKASSRISTEEKRYELMLACQEEALWIKLKETHL